MKKNLFGLFAVVLAIAFSAFTAAKFDTSVYFTGNGSSDIYDASLYQTGTISCLGTQTVPCRFVIPSPYTNFADYKANVLDPISDPNAKLAEYNSHVAQRKP